MLESVMRTLRWTGKRGGEVSRKLRRLWQWITGERRRRYYAIKIARIDRDMDESERQMEALLDTETDPRARVQIHNYLWRMRTKRTIQRHLSRY